MGVEKSIRYVREHRVAPLLNDMIEHLLVTKPEDPIPVLIRFLEKKAGISPLVPKPPPKQAEPATPNHHESKKAAAPEEPAAPQDSPKGALVQTAVEPSPKSTIVSHHQPQVPITSEDLGELLDQLVGNEAGVHGLLQQLMDSSEGDAARAALSGSEELSELAEQLRGRHDRVQMGVELVETGMNPTEYVSCQAFKLLAEIDKNEREARAIFKANQEHVSSMDVDTQALLVEAAKNHHAIQALVDEAEATQI